MAHIGSVASGPRSPRNTGTSGSHWKLLASPVGHHPGNNVGVAVRLGVDETDDAGARVARLPDARYHQHLAGRLRRHLPGL